jgi:hypothetical protein
MRSLISIALLLSCVACAQAPRQPVAPQKLYFAVEVHRDGKLVAQPKLLGEEGVALRAERRPPGATASDYTLRLRPVRKGAGYEVDVDLALPGGGGHTELSLLHGEVRRLELGQVPGELSLELLLMEVDSPEFRALMQLANEPGVGGAGAI